MLNSLCANSRPKAHLENLTQTKHPVAELEMHQ